MDFYLKTDFIGKDGDHGYTNGEEYELQVYLTEGDIKIYECPDGNEWEFADLYTFLQNWSDVTLV